MNNNQNNINSNELNITNSNDIINNQNSEQPLNVIPTTDNNRYNNNQQFNSLNDIVPKKAEINQSEHDLINNSVMSNQNRFINQNFDTTSNSLNDLNVESENSNKPKIDYSKEPQVAENIKKRNTVTITSEGKVFIIIIIVLLLFIFVLPKIFDFIRDIIYQ